MEAIGAVASLIQVAQFGTQLSIGLYHIAESIASANQETNYIAKDIALFCTVLKDLAKALDSGQKTRLFRKNAFDTSLKIVEECRRVFVEIEAILKKATKSDNPLEGNLRMPTGHKILWIFRKGKVEFFRRLLDSLKSTILVELAVLNYAMKVTAHTVQDAVDLDELLTLKSLVLANDTAKQELYRQAASSGETLNHDDLSTTGVAPQSVVSLKLQSSVATDIDAIQSRPQGQSNSLQLTDTGLIAPVTAIPSQYWSHTDRLELAAQKLKLARWEYERFEENIALNKVGGSDSTEARHLFLINRLKDGLIKFGMRGELVDAAISILDASRDIPAPERTAVFPKTALDSEQIVSLRASSPIASTEEARSSLRWLPDIFVDILYEHTQDLLERSGIPRLSSITPCTTTTQVPIEGVRVELPFRSNASTQANASLISRSSIVEPRVQNTGVLQVASTNSLEDPARSVHNIEPVSDLDSDLSTYTPERKTVLEGEGAWHSEVEGLTLSLESPVHQGEKRRQDDDMSQRSGRSPEAPYSNLDANIPSLPYVRSVAGSFAGSSIHGASPSIYNDHTTDIPPDESSDDVVLQESGGVMWIRTLSEMAAERSKHDMIIVVQEWLRRSEVGTDLASSDFLAKERSQEPVWAQEVGLRSLDWNAVRDERNGDYDAYDDSDDGLTTIRDGALQILHPDHSSPTSSEPPEARVQPPTSNAAQMEFKLLSRDVESCSVDVTVGSDGDDSHVPSPAYWHTQHEGIEGRNKYFASHNEDNSVQIVRELLLRWTTVDELTALPESMEMVPLRSRTASLDEMLLLES